MATSIDDLDAIINQGKGLVGNSLNNIFNGQSAQSQAEAQTSSPSYTPSNYTYTNYNTAPASTSTSTLPSRNSFLSELGQQIGNFSGGWNGPIDNPLGRATGLNALTDLFGSGVQAIGLDRVLRPVGQAVQTAEALGADGLGLIHNAGVGFDNLLGMAAYKHENPIDIPNPVDQVRQILSDPNNRVAQDAIDKAVNIDPNTPFLANNRLFDPGSLVDTLGQFFLGGKGLGLAGKGLAEAGKGALNLAGKVPAVGKAADALAAENAGAAFDKYNMPSEDPFAASEPSSDTTANPYDPNGTLEGWNPQQYDSAANQSQSVYTAPTPKMQINSDPNTYLNKAIDQIKPDVYQTITPPYENPKELANYVSQFSGFEPTAVAKLPYEDLRQLAEEVHGNLSSGENFLNIGKQAATNQGFNLDSLFAGKAPSIADRVALDNAKRVAGVYDAPNIKVTNPYLKPNPEFTVNPDNMYDPHGTLEGWNPQQYEAAQPETVYQRDPAEDYQNQKSDYVNQSVNSTSTSQKVADLLKAKANANPLVQAGQQLFQKYGGVTEPLANMLRSDSAERNYKKAMIDHAVDSLDKEFNLNPNERLSAAHAIEGSGFVPNPGSKVAQYVKKWKDLMDNGFTSPNGTKIDVGTKAELAKKLYDGTPVLKSTRDNYLSHYYDNNPEEIAKAFSKAPNDTYTSIEGSFNKQRKFNTLAQARAAKLNPITDPSEIIRRRLKDSVDALHNTDLINNIRSNPDIPMYSKSTVKKMTKNVKTGAESPDILPDNYKQSRVAEMNGASMPEKDEAALWNHINPNRRVPNNLAGKLAVNTWDKLNDIPKHLMYSLPFRHMLNVAYNGIINGGADVGKSASYTTQLMKGEMPAMVERATKAGAVSADTERASSPLMERIMKVLSLGTKDFNQKLLWNTDKGFRTSLFEKYVNDGMSDAEAADKVNQKMVDYNNVTNFEKNWMTRILPFYRWQKGNMKSQLTSLPQYLAYSNAADKVNQAYNGNHTDDEGRLIGGTENGMQNRLDLAMPGQDLTKMMAQGLPAYLYSHANPTIHAISQGLSNNKYAPNEFFAPNNAKSLGDLTSGTRITNPMAPASHNAAEIASTLLHDYGTPLSTGLAGSFPVMQGLDHILGVSNKGIPPVTIGSTLEQLLGLHPSQLNLQSQALGQKIDAKNNIALYKAYLRQQQRGN